MNRYLAMWILLAAPLQAALAQKPDTAQILVHYKFSYVRDTNNRAHPYTENMVLFVGKALGSYKSYDRQLQNDLFRRQFQEQLLNSADGNIRLDRKMTGSGTEYSQFINNRELVRREVIGNDAYIIGEALPVINWHISGDKANFGELRCQKATCHFKGRDYTAWFCPDLPVHVGPWKLNGLPGVIVEAYDSKKEVVFKFDRVEKAVLGARKPIKDRHGRIIAPPGDDGDDTDPNIIQVPTKGIKTTNKEFEKLQAVMRRDPNAFAQAMTGGKGSDGPKLDRKAGPGILINNPIELPEKR
ncbi:GLPGLI family protein [Mucilaginibacter ginsenosidivorans]|uniref:GLPGLI family protein n=1 Tax=Mucilaginibacter ginsenosidivorans TaxID=398053 RepID=A0A5B8UVT9_9SPHI|nr:GLPGLI family protein [Mucilaginibacter ginsenosidivorans]QEC63008.1 GLPGLI family protein [Mucilaginibacter ginsenosidivorans]